eukprot:226785-Amphidinium_carterae.2
MKWRQRMPCIKGRWEPHPQPLKRPPLTNSRRLQSPRDCLDACAVSLVTSLESPALWGAVYSAEVMMRHAHLERLRRRGAPCLSASRGVALCVHLGRVQSETRAMPFWARRFAISCNLGGVTRIVVNISSCFPERPTTEGDLLLMKVYSRILFRPFRRMESRLLGSLPLLSVDMPLPTWQGGSPFTVPAVVNKKGLARVLPLPFDGKVGALGLAFETDAIFGTFVPDFGSWEV